MRSWSGTCLGRRGSQWRSPQKLPYVPRCVSRLVDQLGMATPGFVSFSIRTFSFLLPSYYRPDPPYPLLHADLLSGVHLHSCNIYLLSFQYIPYCYLHPPIGGIDMVVSAQGFYASETHTLY